ncbi:Septum formation initiator [Desulfacinum hydrothermale DSM 13146]|uniref:Septum formation initiator n=1 Tax=Desulfacinum hydrothermale DSM 13146 TaxID=1121390 RepID=A0A1W1XSQ0_9BACT|nr:septum formation initiator family protein [Desulfacinum hydrothermale]SMC26558.1 Septum formation initiator [Desulfacinum hydrothermale DSM 13146]
MTRPSGLHTVRKYLGAPLVVVLLAVVNLVLLQAVFFSPKGVAGLRNKREQVRKLRTETRQLQARCRQLYREVNRLAHERPYQERVVRQELGWVGPDEILVRFLPPERRP